MHSYTTTTCGKRRGGLLELQVENGRRVFVPTVPPCGLRRSFSLLPTSFQTWQLLFCLFSLYKEKTSRELRADGSHVTGLCMDGIAFSMTTVKWAACWHSKRQRTTNTNQSSSLTCFHPLPKNAITGPYPWHAIIPVMNQGHLRKREREELGSTSFFPPLFCRYYFCFNAILHLNVWLNAKDSFRGSASFVCLLESAFPHVCVLK